MPHRRSRRGQEKRHERRQSHLQRRDWYETIRRHSFYEVIERELINLKEFTIGRLNRPGYHIAWQGLVLEDPFNRGFLQLQNK